MLIKKILLQVLLIFLISCSIVDTNKYSNKKFYYTSKIDHVDGKVYPSDGVFYVTDSTIEYVDTLYQVITLKCNRSACGWKTDGSKKYKFT